LGESGQSRRLRRSAMGMADDRWERRMGGKKRRKGMTAET